VQEIQFTIPVTGTIRIDDNEMTITIDQAETTLPIPKTRKRIALQKGQTVFDIVLQTARDLVASTKHNRFTAAELYHKVVERYPDMKRNSWVSHVIASAPNHPSYNHFATKKDYFRYLGDGSYQLDNQYLNR
jgi:hypothetical protein